MKVKLKIEKTIIDKDFFLILCPFIFFKFEQTKPVKFGWRAITDYQSIRIDKIENYRTTIKCIWEIINITKTMNL